MQGRLTDLIYSLIEHKDEFIRYHEVQSIIFFGAITAVCIVFSFSQWIPGHVGVLFTAIISTGGLFAFYYAERAHGESLPGEALRLPVAGDLARGIIVPRAKTGLTAGDRAVKAQGRADQATPDFVYVVVRRNSISD